MCGAVPYPPRSSPEQKPRPAPVMITTRATGSTAMSSRWRCRDSTMSAVIAFSESGRFRVSCTTPARGSWRSTSDMAASLLMVLRGDDSRLVPSPGCLRSLCPHRCRSGRSIHRTHSPRSVPRSTWPPRWRPSGTAGSTRPRCSVRSAVAAPRRERSSTPRTPPTGPAPYGSGGPVGATTSTATGAGATGSPRDPADARPRRHWARGRRHGGLVADGGRRPARFERRRDRCRLEPVPRAAAHDRRAAHHGSRGPSAVATSVRRTGRAGTRAVHRPPSSAGARAPARVGRPGGSIRSASSASGRPRSSRSPAIPPGSGSGPTCHPTSRPASCGCCPGSAPGPSAPCWGPPWAIPTRSPSATTT